MLLDFINIAKIRKAILCFLVLLGVLLLQDIVLSRIEIFGVRPMIIPIAAASIGYFNGGVWGGVFGILAGLSADASLNGSSVMMTVLFPAIGFFAGALPMFLISRRFLSFFLVNLGALLLTAFFQMFRFLVFTDTAAGPLLLTLALQTLWSAPFIFVVYYPCRAIARRDLSK